MAGTIGDKLNAFARRHRGLLDFMLMKLADANLLLFPINEKKGRETLHLIRRIKSEKRLLQAFHQAYNLVRAVEATRTIPGDLAEVGVYRGGSAKLICEVKAGRTLHLFDTFEGLPAVRSTDAPLFREGHYSAPSVDEVKTYLRGYANLAFHVGLFPETADPVRETMFSFVHLDVDLVQSTEDCLAFFYPRMNPGGIFLSQDYGFSGVREVINTFFADRPEPIMELCSTQCMIVKLGNL